MGILRLNKRNSPCVSSLDLEDAIREQWQYQMSAIPSAIMLYDAIFFFDEVNASVITSMGCSRITEAHRL